MYRLLRYYTILQCEEILAIIEGDDNINKWISLLIAGKVHRISRLSVDGATDGKMNVVNKNLRLNFASSMTFLEVLKDCHDIPCRRLPPFVSCINVSSRLRSCDNVIGNIV